MKIPREFAQKATRTFGVEGERWLERIPLLLVHCQEKWQLADCALVDECSVNLVFFARSKIYGDVVLNVLSTCWGYEMNYEPERIAAGVRASEEIRRYVLEL